MKIDENLKFSISLIIFPLIPAFILLKHSKLDIAIIVVLSFFILAILTLLSNRFAKMCRKMLKKIGNIIGNIISKLLLCVIYIIAVIPTSLIMKTVKRDRLLLEKQDTFSYWKNKQDDISDYECQY